MAIISAGVFCQTLLYSEPTNYEFYNDSGASLPNCSISGSGTYGKLEYTMGAGCYSCNESTTSFLPKIEIDQHYRVICRGSMVTDACPDKHEFFPIKALETSTSSHTFELLDANCQDPYDSAT